MNETATESEVEATDYRHLDAVLDSIVNDDPEPRQALETAIAIYRTAALSAKELLTPWEQVQVRAKAIVMEVFQREQIASAKTRAGQAYITAGSMSVSYDARALDALAASNDELQRVLQPHRQEKWRPGALTIR